ncbi:MAG: hypothetical protein LBF71_04715 [Campylobacteraceae bacterium]|jgi:hypothetical protein|nr:hypothetical protein [Campylobacteraceae bacterium]
MEHFNAELIFNSQLLGNQKYITTDIEGNTFILTLADVYKDEGIKTVSGYLNLENAAKLRDLLNDFIDKGAK